MGSSNRSITGADWVAFDGTRVLLGMSRVAAFRVSVSLFIMSITTQAVLKIVFRYVSSLLATQIECRKH
jgi:hypothetical protein